MINDDQTSNIRFQGFTDTWEQRKFSELAEIRRGLTYKPSDVCEYGVRVLRSSNINEDSFVVGEDDVFVKKEAVNIPYTKPGDILITSANGSSRLVGKHAIIDGIADNSTVHGGFMLLASAKNPQFINALMGSSWYTKFINTYVAGGNGAIGNLNKRDLDEQSVLVPSEPEQRLIGAFFQDLDNLITLHQREHNKITSVKKSMLEKMFPRDGERTPQIRFAGFTDAWEQRKIGELVKAHNAGIYISKENYGQGTNVIGVGNIYDNDIFNGEIYRFGPVNDDKFLLDEGDLIYGESSLVLEGIARTVCVGKNGAGSAFAWHTRRVKLDNDLVDSHFATLELNYHPVVRKHLMSVATQTALTGMTTDGYFSAPLFLPSVPEQKKISEVFKNIDNLITLHQRELEKLQNIKTAFIEKMFM